MQLVQQRDRVVDLTGQRRPEVLPVAADRVLPVRVGGDGVVLGLLPVAPRVLGGGRAKGSVSGRGFRLDETPRLSDFAVERVGGDLLVTGRLA